ncbi:MAG: hypothetical protein D6690_02525 [Nitrospirae bacterium]|nr:MAG: hypothetical protein D6690_02525 [Nitrospirota bacterium]
MFEFRWQCPAWRDEDHETPVGFDAGKGQFQAAVGGRVFHDVVEVQDQEDGILFGGEILKGFRVGTAGIDNPALPKVAEPTGCGDGEDGGLLLVRREGIEEPGGEPVFFDGLHGDGRIAGVAVRENLHRQAPWVRGGRDGSGRGIRDGRATRPFSQAKKFAQKRVIHGRRGL